MISLLHTPDGVRDLYGAELKEKRRIASNINKTIGLYGYEAISTPAFEYFDVFSRDIGTTPSKDLYKFFDKEGNTLVLRPDFTPSVARCAAKYFSEESMPLRFCYEGDTFINTSELQGKLKETTQIGFELINDSSIYADAESIIIVIESLLNCGLKEFQVSIGESNYFKGICEEANLDEETELKLRDYITSKNFYGSREFLSEQKIDATLLDQLEAISKVFLPEKDLEALFKNATNERSKNAIRRLLDIQKLVAKAGYDKYVSFDLSMLSKYHYYTGIIFTAYTYGVGDAIVKGGRYDRLIGKFGKEAPSVGCVFLIDEILNVIRRNRLSVSDDSEKKTLIIYKAEKYEQALEEAKRIRKDDIPAELILWDEEKNAEYYEKKAAEYGNQCFFIQD
ncbi:MAG: ATP phosphoribosyltransferase regulatory subunit [Lachnospiraceae bacterium]|nr:ATP phosphoribosyltransferase regulatory subunit [Lachnospiraceae bacterium]